MSSPMADATIPDPSAGWAAPGSARSLSMRDFRLFQALIQREAGIHLSDAKRVLVEGRLARRLRGQSSAGRDQR